jgi:hypothetical protein
VRLVYQRFIAESNREVEAETRKLAEFSESLEAAGDDAARLSIILAADPKFLAEWRWRQTATTEDWRKRYLAML